MKIKRVKQGSVLRHKLTDKLYKVSELRNDEYIIVVVKKNPRFNLLGEPNTVIRKKSEIEKRFYLESE